jgi:hypothetical protein
MSNERDSKVWVIDETKQDGASGVPAKLQSAPLVRARGYRERKTSAAGERPLLRILLAYLLGPFAADRWHPFWTPAAALGLLLSSLLMATGLLDSSELARGRSLALFLHGMAALGILVTLSGWSLAIRGAGATLARQRHALPAMLRRPGPAAFVGLWLPGFALLLAGSPRRAAMALWNFGPLACALFILLRPGHAQGWTVWVGYERLLAVALVTTLAAGLLWMAWALEGLRVQLRHVRSAGGLRGDRLALWLLASLAVFFIAFQPVGTAEILHRRADMLAGQGFRLLPLTLERAALHLDGSRPDYWLRAADHCEALGREQEAAQFRGRIWLQWRELQDSLGTSLREMGLASSPRRLPETSAVPTLRRPWSAASQTGARYRYPVPLTVSMKRACSPSFFRSPATTVSTTLLPPS